MKQIEFHYASDRRCYYGCPSSDLKKEWDSVAKAKCSLAKEGLSITHFPYGDYYIGFRNHKDKAPDVLTDEFKTFESCYRELVRLTALRVRSE